MTVFATLNESTQLGVDRIATSPVALALYRNLLAAFEGDATAVAAGILLQTAAIADLAVTTGKIANLAVDGGKIANLAVAEGKLANSAVAQAKLKTTTASASNGVSANSGATLALTGGTYSWYTVGAEESGGTSGIMYGGGNTAAGTIGFFNGDGTTRSYFVDERYVQASPPYDLGHGEIPLFVMALVDGAGNVRSASVAPDPTWAYHGPTDIRPERIDAQGRCYRRYRELAGAPLAAAIKDAVALRRFLAGEIEVQLVEREITHEIKNRDMDAFPHPWVGNDLAGLTAVMLDPLSPLVGRLAMISEEAGASEVRRIIDAGYLRIDNSALAMRAPRGVSAVAASWR